MTCRVTSACCHWNCDSGAPPTHVVRSKNERFIRILEALKNPQQRVALTFHDTLRQCGLGRAVENCRGTWDPLVPCPFCHNLPRLSPRNLCIVLRSDRAHLNMRLYVNSKTRKRGS